MAFPGATPSYAGFTAGHTLAQDSHAAQSNAEQADIIALSNKLGTGASTPTSGLFLRGNGTGTSAWAQVQASTDLTGVLPVANGGTGIAAIGAGVANFLATPNSANLVTAVTDETGSGSLVFGTSPTIVTPTIASFVNATHDHSNAANGGATLNSPTIVTPTIAQINNSTGVKLQLNTQTDNSNTIASAVTAGLIVQSGWGQVIGGGAQNVTDTVTFPNAFTTILTVLVAPLGFHTASTPATTITGLTGTYGTKSVSAVPEDITTSGFTVELGQSTGTFTNTIYFGYSWIAIGI